MPVAIGGGLVLTVVVLTSLLVGPINRLYLLSRSELIRCISLLSYLARLVNLLACILLGMAWCNVPQVLVRQCSISFLEVVNPQNLMNLMNATVTLHTLWVMDPGCSLRLRIYGRFLEQTLQVALSRLVNGRG